MSYTFLFKYIVIGDSGVGKSCLLLQYTDKRYRQKHQVTIGVQFGAKLINIHENNIKLQIWDTAGQQSFKAITKGYYRNAIAAIICYDVSNKQSFQHVARWLDQAKSNGSNNLNFILVGNKSDKSADRKVTYEEGLRFAKQQNIPFLQSSAKTGIKIFYIQILTQGNNVQQIFNTLTQQVLARIQNGSINVKGHPGIKIGNQSYKTQNKQLNINIKSQKTSFDSEKIDLKKKNNQENNNRKCYGCKGR